VKVFEEVAEVPVSMLVHANYLGREFQRAEEALRTGDDYIQD
jgi:dihydropteroate synthase